MCEQEHSIYAPPYSATTWYIVIDYTASRLAVQHSFYTTMVVHFTPWLG